MAENEIEKKVVLIVDDKPEYLYVLISFLEMYNFNIKVANSGEEVFNRLKSCRPDIILLDIMMPGIDGFETCSRLKKSENHRDIPVIFMSAMNDAVDKVKGLNLGAVDYITKPFKQAEVLASITNHLHIQDLKNRLKFANRTLKKRVKERTVELEITNQKLIDEIEKRENAETAYQKMSQKLLNAYEDERTRIAMELHDGLGQGMLTTKLSLQMVNRDLMDPQISNVVAALDDNINELRNICSGRSQFC